MRHLLFLIDEYRYMLNDRRKTQESIWFRIMWIKLILSQIAILSESYNPDHFLFQVVKSETGFNDFSRVFRKIYKKQKVYQNLILSHKMEFRKFNFFIWITVKFIYMSRCRDSPSATVTDHSEPFAIVTEHNWPLSNISVTYVTSVALIYSCNASHDKIRWWYGTLISRCLKLCNVG